MSPDDKLIRLIRKLQNRQSKVGISLDEEIDRVGAGRPGQALVNVTRAFRSHDVPLSSQEWNDMRSLEQHFNVHIEDLRHLVS